MQKLMFAQDTGGAIRGSVRADFFWGFGDSAGRMALATNETMQMWLLLPAQQPISAVAAKGMRLRGDKAELPDCVIADERSGEHTSELQSLMRISYAVFCLKKKKTKKDKPI